jgi:hypothetical protein
MDASGLLPTVIGVLVLVFNKRLSRAQIESQNKAWGHHFGAKMLRFVRVVWVAAGIIFLLMGLLALCGIIHFNNGQQAR